MTLPTLVVKAGQTIKVIATSGERKKPYGKLAIGFRREHDYSCNENGKTHNDMGGPQWWATANEDGIATTFAIPGELKASVYTPHWRSEAVIQVTSTTDPTTIRLHREFHTKRRVTGKSVLGEAVQTSLEGAEVKIGSIDGWRL